MKRYILSLTLILAVIVIFHPNSYAQCKRELQFSGSSFAPLGPDYKPVMKDAIPASQFFPHYKYEIQYLNNTIDYKITEFRNNQEKVYLDTWCMGQVWEKIDPTLMSQMSRTVSFKANPGDEISFFRELSWYNPAVRKFDPSIYYAGHNISFTVQLLDARSHTPIALLDTIGFARQIPAGNPSLYSWKPILDIVKFTVPKDVKRDSVYLRVNVALKDGSEEHDLYRLDGLSINQSSRDMSEPEWIAFSNGAEKFNHRQNIPTLLEQNSILQVPAEITAGSKFIIKISNEGVEDSELRILNSSTGDIIFNQIINSNEITTNISKPGSYLISILRNEQTLATQQILVK